MTADQWQRVKDLFAAALGQSPANRSRWLSEVCQDAEILDEVESLLAANDQVGEFIQEPLAGIDMANLAPDSRQGQVLGAWRLLEEIGRGGMGTVWLAERADGAFKKKVALKIVSRGMDTDLILRRFHRERQILASLNHPNITALLDGGTSPDGLPYFVMELVEGNPITTFCRDRALPLRARLELFCTICDGVEYAHRNHVLHRDSKPSNILVTAEGVPKLLDFGIAKLLTAAPGADTTLMIGPLQLLTPEYASPEQVRAEAVSERTDVYSLGVILYELVAGCRPYEFRTRSAQEIASTICEREPVLPSLATRQTQFKGDVDSIVMTALRKEPQLRYSSAHDLAADIGRHLAAQPVRAVRPALTYRASKLWRRQRAFIGVAMTVILAVFTLSRFSSPNTSPLAQPEVVQLTTLPGRERNPSFSPDGSSLAFSWQGQDGNNWDIHTMPANGGDPRRLSTDPAPDVSPVWSPNGESIAFLRLMAGGKARVVMVPARGGVERLLAETDAPFAFDFYSEAYLAWSADGRWLVIPEKVSGQQAVGLTMLSLATLERHRLTSPPAAFLGDSNPAFSPQGDSVAFTRASSMFVSDLYTISVRGAGTPSQEPQQLTSGKQWVLGAIWTPDGREVIYSSGPIATRNLFRIAASRDGRASGTPTQIMSSMASLFYGFAISWNSHRLVYEREDSDYNIWRLKLTGDEPCLEGGRLRYGAASRFIASTLTDAFPQYSPDGKKVAFMSYRSGSPQIWVSEGDGTNPRQISTTSGMTGNPQWSPDGARVVFDARPQGQADIYVVDLQRSATRPLTQGPAENFAPSWSRNGDWIYFVSRRSGNAQIWKMPADGGGEPVQLTRNGGFGGMESTDGRFFYYAKENEKTTLWRTPVNGGDEIKVLESLHNFASFAVTAQGIFYIPGQSDPPSIKFFSFATQTSTIVATLSAEVSLGLSVSPDHKWILCTLSDRKESDLILVKGFRLP